MARFNTPVAEAKTRTKNLAGGDAYAQSPELELVSILLTSFVSDQYYRSADTTTDRVRQLVAALGDKKFAAQAAVYARNEFGMRSISHLVAGEIARHVKGEDWTKDFFNAVVRRPDDVTEILSYYLNVHGHDAVNKNGRHVRRAVPNAMKKGLGRALFRFDKYQLAKYRGTRSRLSMIDAINLVHPQRSDAINALMTGVLAPAETWETKLTQAGQKAETDEEKAALKADAWKGLIESRKIPQMALLRNLRNIVEQAPELIDAAAELLKDEKRIRSSLIFPFRYLTAYRMLQDVRGAKKLLSATSKAATLALDNVPVFEGKTLVAIDTSGSMQTAMSENSVVVRAEIAIVFAAALDRGGDVDTMIFGNTAKLISLDPDSGLLSIADGIRRRIGEVGHGTSFADCFAKARAVYDRVIFFSDMQAWRPSVFGDDATTARAKYCKRTGANPYSYCVDLAGYGTAQFSPDRRYEIAGFSEKIFDLMRQLEQDPQVLVNTIRKVTF